MNRLYRKASIGGELRVIQLGKTRFLIYLYIYPIKAQEKKASLHMMS